MPKSRRQNGSIATLCAILASFPLAGCGLRDTCTDGDNMTNPRLANGLEEIDGGLVVRILWDQGTGQGQELQDDYFAAVSLVGSDLLPTVQTELIESVELTASRELTVHFAEGIDTAYFAQNQQVAFDLLFPDRAQFIDCTHPGMPDRYILTVTISFNGQGELIGAELEQDKLLGAI